MNESEFHDERDDNDEAEIVQQPSADTNAPMRLRGQRRVLPASRARSWAPSVLLQASESGAR